MTRRAKNSSNTTVPKPEEKVKAEPPHLLKGVKDILPREQPYWQYVLEKVEHFAKIYGYEKIATPIIEETSLFQRAVGQDTDIIEKEIYTFSDKERNEVCLRPEATASVARSYIEHGMANLPQPVRFFYTGPMFRYNPKPTGRLSQFHQFGFESIGDNHPVLDAELILMIANLYQYFGLNVFIQLNSIGCHSCREEYIQLLQEYYRTRKKFLCETCKRRLVKNPLRVLDCREEDCRELATDTPQIVDHLCEECRDHFVKVLEHLDEAEIPYNLNSKIVRGLNYYSKTTFEIWATNDEKKGPLSTLGGGGRYDDLISVLGGQEDAPAIGFAGEIEKLISTLKEKEIKAKEPVKPEVFLAQLGYSAKKKSLKLFEELRRSDIDVRQAFFKDGLTPQLAIANKIGVKFTLIMGQKEVLDKTILLREMEGGAQEIIDYKKIIDELKKRLSKVNGERDNNADVKE